MQNYLEFTVLENGNLNIKATDAGIEYLKETFGDDMAKTYDHIWAELLESTSCNGSYCKVEPEEVSALTESIIIADGYEFTYSEDEADTYEKQIAKTYGKVWWFPEYCIIDEIEKLMLGETIEFTKADDAE